MLKIRSVFRRMPSVTYSRGKYRVYGSTADVLRLCAACVLALEQRGLDTIRLRGDLYDVALESCRHTTDRLEAVQND